jgi:monofunctional glycosyltransferase
MSNPPPPDKPTLRQRLAYWRWQLFKFLAITYGLGVPVYAVICRYILPPITWGQLESLIQYPQSFRREHVPIDQISPHVLLAVISSEDGQFPNHNGFDWEAIKAAWANRQGGGGSTISQQTAKNVFLTLDSNWLRKALEIYPTWVIEKAWGKRRVLEIYLNSIEFERGVWGVEAAARKYFDRPASKLTRSQAAWLAACLPNPKGCLSDRRHTSAQLAKRQRRILKEMAYLEQLNTVRQLLDPITPR